MLLLFLIFGLIATAIPVSKMMVLQLPPMLYVGIRMTLAGGILLLLSYRKSRRLRISYIKRDFWPIIYITLMITFIPALLKAYALKNLTASLASFFRALGPFIAALYVYLVYGEKLSLPNVIGMFLGWLGFFIVMVPDKSTLLSTRLFEYPCLAGLLAVVIVKIGWILVQDAIKKDRYSSSELNGLTMFLGGCLALVVSFLLDTDVFTQLTGALTPLFIFSTGYTIIVGTLIAYTFYGYCLKKNSTVSMSLIEFSTPLFVHMYDWLIFGESLSFQFFIACFITISGLLIFKYDQLKEELSLKRKFFFRVGGFRTINESIKELISFINEKLV